MQEQGGEGGADQLDHDVAGDPAPGEVTRSAKAMLTAGLRCTPEILPMYKMMPMTISPGAMTAAVWLITPGKAG